MAGAVETTGGGSLRRLLADAPMGSVQIFAVALSIALNALDGFDVLAITYALPGISHEWGTSPTALGVAISSGLAGMAAGSLLLAPFGDRYGRRPLVLLCLVLMTAGMFLTATAHDITMLCVWRVLTGLGIGGMVATINAVAAEFSNERRRDLSVALMTVGYPAGGLLGGLAVAEFIDDFGWRSVFVFGGILSAVFLPLIWLALPESLEHLERDGSPAARAKLTRLLQRMGHRDFRLDPAPAADAPRQRTSVAELFGPGYRWITILLVASYFLHITTFYFFSGWLPKMMSDIGFGQADAIRTSAIMSMGGVIGGGVLGWLAPVFGLKRLVVLSMVATTVTMGVFGFLTNLQQLQVVAFFVGVAIFGGIVGLYASLARGFAARMRVTGTGLAIGLGRGGAVIGPVIGGILQQGGMRVGLIIAVVGLCGVVAALFLALVPRPPQEE